MDCSPLGPSVHGIFHERILEWVAISSSRGCSQPRDQTHVSCILYHWSTWGTRTVLPLSYHFSLGLVGGKHQWAGRDRPGYFFFLSHPPLTQEFWIQLHLLLASPSPRLALSPFSSGSLSSLDPSSQSGWQPPTAVVPGSQLSWLLLYYTTFLPSETKLPKFSKVTSLYRSLWAGSRHFHSSWENSTATSLNVTNPWNNKPRHYQ